LTHIQYGYGYICLSIEQLYSFRTVARSHDLIPAKYLFDGCGHCGRLINKQYFIGHDLSSLGNVISFSRLGPVSLHEIFQVSSAQVGLLPMIKIVQFL
jgi:hypothetical protein